MLRRMIHGAVLRTRGFAGLAPLYRGAYASALEESARALGSLDGVDGVSLHRGLSRGSCVPGVSDIDLLLALESRPPERELPFLRALAGTYGELKRSFPMLGDLWLGTRAEFQAYLRWGGLRVWEDVPFWKPLHGEGPSSGEVSMLAESPEKKRWLDPWTWVFHSYMELSRRVFIPRAGPEGKLRAERLKLLADLRRYAVLLEDGPLTERPLSREEAARRISPEEMEPAASWNSAAKTVRKLSRKVLDKLGGVGFASLELPEPPARFRPVLEGLLGDPAFRVVQDLPYHTYLLVPEDAGEPEFSRAADLLMRRPFHGVPLVLTPSTWALCLQSSYLGAPLGLLGGPVAAPVSDYGFFPGWTAFGVGPGHDALPLLPARLRWEAAAEAASWMAIWWRYLWIDASAGNRFVLYHLHTRALGLRLALEGLGPVPFDRPELLLGAAGEAFAGERPWLESLALFLREEPVECAEGLGRSDLDPGHLEGLAFQMRGIQRALKRGGPACPAG